MWGRMCTNISPEPLSHMAIFTLFNVGKGVGNIVAGPISAGLMRFSGGGGRNEVDKYGPVILFTGGCMFCSGFVVVGFVGWGWVRRDGGGAGM